MPVSDAVESSASRGGTNLFKVGLRRGAEKSGWRVRS